MLTEIVNRAQALPASEALAIDQHLMHWEPMISALVAAVSGNMTAAAVLDATLNTLEREEDWQVLATLLRQVKAGDRRPQQTAALNPIGKAILSRALTALDGTNPVDTSTWSTSPSDPMSYANHERDRIGMAPAPGAIAALYSDAVDTVDRLNELMDELSSDSDLDQLTDVLRRIVAEAGDDRPTRTLTPLERAATAAVRGCLTELRGIVSRPPGLQQIIATIRGVLADEPRIDHRSGTLVTTPLIVDTYSTG